MMISSPLEINARGRKRRAICRRVASTETRVGNDLPFFAIGSAASKRGAPGRIERRAPIGNKRDV